MFLFLFCCLPPIEVSNPLEVLYYCVRFLLEKIGSIDAKTPRLDPARFASVNKDSTGVQVRRFVRFS